MAKKKSAKPPVKAEATAKAELVAKATYQRKHSTTEVIPPDVTRARAGAWLDLISPMTEWAGLRGDQLRYKRQQLRIEQESVLLKIAQKAREQLDIEGGAPGVAIPNKFVVPFLEKASLEDFSSPLCNAWANLFVEAASNFDPKLQVYSDILSRLSWREAKFLYDVCKNTGEADGPYWPDVHFEHNKNVIEDHLQVLIGRSLSGDVRWKKFNSEVSKGLEFSYLIHAAAPHYPDGWGYYYNKSYLSEIKSPSILFDMLERERLVRKTLRPVRVDKRHSEGSISYIDLTYLAIDLIRVCTRDFSVDVFDE
jgi:hypothetical protein